MGTAGRPSRADLEAEIRVGWRMAGLGMEVAAQVAAGTILGWLFDLLQGTSPNGILVGSVLGIVVGLWSLIRGALKLNRQLDRMHPTTGRGRPLPPNDDWQLHDDDDTSSDDRPDDQPGETR
ncbi:MAG: AtpZ/AtpI family protein [Phycisphaerales bacterium]